MNRVPPVEHLASDTRFLKYWLPGVLILGLSTAAYSEVKQSGVIAAVIPAAFCLIVILSLRLVARGLVDEVLDGGDFLRIRKGDVVEDLPLDDVEAVSNAWWFGGIPRIEVVRKTPGRLGRAIQFIPIRYSLLPFKTNPLISELEQRVERSKRDTAVHEKK